MQRLVYIVCLAFAALSACVAGTVEMQPSCLTSSNITPEAMVFVGGETLSCARLEYRRVDLFKAASAAPSTGKAQGEMIAAAIANLERSIGELETKKDWLGIRKLVTGNAMATFGLASCLETVGIGCAVAILGKWMAFDNLLTMGANETVKAKEVQAKRVELAIPQDVARKNGPKVEAAKLRDRMISEFNAVCVQVRKDCVLR